MKKITGFVFGGLLVACGADVSDFSAEMLADAGEIIADAGQAIADAGRGVADSGTADAQADPAPAKRTVELACTLERAYGSGSGSISTKEYFAAFDVAAEDVRAAWVCDRRTPGVPWPCPGTSCTGVTVPTSKCDQAAMFEADDGRIWVHCGERYRKARLVLD